MTIKEVGETYGVSGDTLRYYERVGMIPPVKRTAGGIRDHLIHGFTGIIECGGCVAVVFYPWRAGGQSHSLYILSLKSILLLLYQDFRRISTLLEKVLIDLNNFTCIRRAEGV